jgi:DNA-binding NarL/FixJ family response regulator
MRVLLFACGADEARLMMIYSDRMEITYLPSYDMEEVREEIERSKPKLILCGANAFLDFLPPQPPRAARRPRQNGERTAASAGNPPLGRREKKVLTMLAKGQTNEEIAKALRLSSRTVKRILSSLFERLEVTNRTELAGRVAELSLLEHDD